MFICASFYKSRGRIGVWEWAAWALSVEDRSCGNPPQNIPAAWGKVGGEGIREPGAVSDSYDVVLQRPLPFNGLPNL